MIWIYQFKLDLIHPAWISNHPGDVGWKNYVRPMLLSRPFPLATDPCFPVASATLASDRYELINSEEVNYCVARSWIGGRAMVAQLSSSAGSSSSHQYINEARRPLGVTSITMEPYYDASNIELAQPKNHSLSDCSCGLKCMLSSTVTMRRQGPKILRRPLL